LAIIAVVGAIYYLNTGGQSELNPDASLSSEPARAPAPTKEVPEAAVLAPTASPVASGNASGRPQEDFSKKSATELAPDQQTLRKEAEEDPERVPRSTLFFAARLGKKMEAALKSEEGAASLFQELQDCVTSQRLEGSVTSQTLCLQDAQQLSQAYPSRLKEQYATLFERAEPRVRSLLVPIRH
jgi:hypothetical protein